MRRQIDSAVEIDAWLFLPEDSNGKNPVVEMSNLNLHSLSLANLVVT
ncbi:hypothetical protein HDF17_001910 [Granulicella arctica]|uniref:Uncharacterized protein n=1 Tax=Granulicella arctica TaxID=940613 RepID=A0A7Y9PH26_9BACT|nr:hypothetical protein [Granulicella arctica]